MDPLQQLLASHALDDIASVGSDDEGSHSSSRRSSFDDLRSASVSQLSTKGTRDSEADAVAFVTAADQNLNIKPKQSRVAPAGPIGNFELPPPSKPVKWHLKLADRATAAVTLEAHYKFPPHLLFDLLADPHQHEQIFDAIEHASAELLEDNGPRRKWRLDYTARWTFWKVSGLCQNRMWMWTDRDAGTVTFKLREPGFLKKYEGTWRIAAACGTPLSECYDDLAAAPAGAVSSSSSVVSSPPSSPRHSGMGMSANTSSGMANSSSSSNLRLSPIASVNAATAGGTNGMASPFAGLTGAVAAIARMQAGWQENMCKTINSVSNIGNQLTSGARSGLGGLRMPQMPSALARLGSPWGSINGSSSGSDTAGNADVSSYADAGQQQKQQRRRRPLPIAAVITAETLTSPHITPPYPINQILKSQSKAQVEDMLVGLVRAAAVQLQTRPLEAV
eukprot:GHRR01000704.1.p1 GENE.GHRR01000704.1~~GHRR01000704.1.p1  ORF type:complete len:449 (+),score=139.56 GHRR01000704.1:147-1493(+)